MCCTLLSLAVGDLVRGRNRTKEVSALRVIQRHFTHPYPMCALRVCVCACNIIVKTKSGLSNGCNFFKSQILRDACHENNNCMVGRKSELYTWNVIHTDESLYCRSAGESRVAGNRTSTEPVKFGLVDYTESYSTRRAVDVFLSQSYGTEIKYFARTSCVIRFQT